MFTELVSCDVFETIKFFILKLTDKQNNEPKINNFIKCSLNAISQVNFPFERMIHSRLLEFQVERDFFILLKSPFKQLYLVAKQHEGERRKSKAEL